MDKTYLYKPTTKHHTDQTVYIFLGHIYVPHFRAPDPQVHNVQSLGTHLRNLLQYILHIRVIIHKFPSVLYLQMDYSNTIMGAMASQITRLTIVYSAVYSDVDQRKHQSSASLPFVRGIHRWPVNSPHKWPVTRKMFPFDDVIRVSVARYTHVIYIYRYISRVWVYAHAFRISLRHRPYYLNMNTLCTFYCVASMYIRFVLKNYILNQRFVVWPCRHTNTLRYIAALERQILDEEEFQLFCAMIRFEEFHKVHICIYTDAFLGIKYN